jgi:hypothetical protein
MGETLYPLSTALGLTGLLDYERELLLRQLNPPTPAQIHYDAGRGVAAIKEHGVTLSWPCLFP